MSSAAKARDKALSLVGQGYIYGAKGQKCSPAFRAQQAQQYPEQAEHILGTGAKWDGVPVWDCAQLTRACAKEGGVEMVSGATSQWNKTDWEKRGEIDTLPAGTIAFLYRRKNGSSTTMQHTGMAMGDGTCVHARGTAYGVVRQKMGEHAWTHWAIPKWPDGNSEEVEKPMDVLYEATVTAAKGNTVNMRAEPGGDVLARVPLGDTVSVLAEAAGWCKVQWKGKTGYMQTGFLARKEGQETDGMMTDFETQCLKLLEGILEAVKG